MYRVTRTVCIGILIAVSGVAVPACRTLFSASVQEPPALSEVNDFLYQLQNVDPDAVGRSRYDLVIIDYSRDGSDGEKWSPAQIGVIKSSGEGRLALAYLSIGEAEDYRVYWQLPWPSGAPDWLGRENPDWDGNYKVKYWDPGWFDVLKAYLTTIVSQGFDGVYLDVIDAYEYWANDAILAGETESLDLVDAADRMADLVEAITSFARNDLGKPSFIICPQNGTGIISDASPAERSAYIDAIDAVGVEDVFFYGSGNMDNPYNLQTEVLADLGSFRRAGKVVLVTDYLSQSSTADVAGSMAKRRLGASFPSPRTGPWIVQGSIPVLSRTDLVWQRSNRTRRPIPAFRSRPKTSWKGEEGRNPLKRLLPFFGPAFIASIAYVDPGNFATNIQAGSAFGYTLIWVIVASNLMAMLIQTLSAKLGMTTGKNLAEHCRLRMPRPVVLTLWVLMEFVAIATDLAEFLGAALGFNLLLGVPLVIGGLLTAVFTYAILGLERFGFKPFEAVITGFVAVIALCYLFETLVESPDWFDIGYNIVVPRFKGPQSVVLAAGILGATVMPHAIFLHSALMQGRIRVSDPVLLKRLYRFEIVDVVVAMGVASLVNGAMLVMSAATFHTSGYQDIATIEEAYKTLEPLLGKAAGTVFALSLLASGLSSSAVGTSAGQIIMQGFLERHIPVAVRRLITILPALLVIMLGFDPTSTLVLSQVVLSFGLPFVIIPLVFFTHNKTIMGPLANTRPTTVLAAIVATIVVALNLYLLYQIFSGGGI